ncbi:MAG TPA: methyltransferase domain-containing protein [Terriglobales bacterium]|nr:methyltransferase domain-containing protein [Terriglobales bacterium]
MRYAEQEQYLRASRLWCAATVFLLLGIAAFWAVFFPHASRSLYAPFAISIAVLATSICYTPDYLYLTVDPAKPARWQIKIRWRIIGAVLIVSAFLIASVADGVLLSIAICWLAAANVLARKLPPQRAPIFFWGTDFFLLGALLLNGRLNPTIVAVLLATAANLAVVIAGRRAAAWAAVIGVSGSLLLLLFWHTREVFAAIGLLLFTAFATAYLVLRSQQHNQKNVDSAITELQKFTGYSPERIRELWLLSNQKLAENWKSAAPTQDDAERLAEWYRENSLLYLFAISAYNLEYKRIRSNLKVLHLARGSCLDYGAGNGEIVLELARRGHPVAYYDVEGETMKFARQRAAQQGLDVRFFHAKEDLAMFAQVGRLDTVFSFDVLEHLPDLPGELNFLASLLSPGGLLVFDVPAGSTKAHPMHLNHDLDIRAHLAAKGLRPERTVLQKLSFRKEEKYFFRAAGKRGPQPA